MLVNSITDFSFWLLILIQVVGFILVCIKLYAKSYSAEKGKNLATKEDIGEITQIVEGVKTSLAIEIEKLKSDISYKNEHLIHLRATERAAIINYYKATWALVLNLGRVDLLKEEIDYFDPDTDSISELELRRYASDAELILNKTKEDIINLKYAKDIAESELNFFYDSNEINSITKELNLSLFEFERNLVKAANSMLQVFKDMIVKMESGQSTKNTTIETQRIRSFILANWYENRYTSLSFFRTFNESLKTALHKRLKSLTF